MSNLFHPFDATRPREFLNDADVAQNLTGKLAARRILLAIIANRLNTPNAYEA